MTKETEVFIYALLDPRTGKIRYIGKTNNINRRYSQHLRIRNDQKMTPTKAWIQSLIKQGLKPNMMVIDSCGESQWEDLERKYIKQFRDGGHDILNISDGGNQPWCDNKTRIQNGKNSDSVKQKGILYVLRSLKSAVQEAEKKGNFERASYFSRVINVVTDTKSEIREKINAYGLRLIKNG